MAVESIFLSTLLLSFAATLLLAGLFGAYYGKGRSRSLGIALFLVAVLLIGLFCALTWPLIQGITPIFDPEAVGRAMAAVGAATLGFAIALGVFVFTVVRS
jgi:MFS family permease